jgi:hypothetical protein
MPYTQRRKWRKKRAWPVGTFLFLAACSFVLPGGPKVMRLQLRVRKKNIVDGADRTANALSSHGEGMK